MTLGTSLVRLGRAHCKVATLQEAFALTFQDTFVASLGKINNDFKDYDLQRKKLDSKRSVLNQNANFKHLKTKTEHFMA